MKITTIWFKEDYLYGRDEEGKVWRQSLLWYPGLREASDEERAQYRFGLDGIHWRNLDEDVSFESFGYEDAEPTGLQRFFLTHKEVDVDEFARLAGVDASLLRDFVHGFKKPSEEQERRILEHIHKVGSEFLQVSF